MAGGGHRHLHRRSRVSEDGRSAGERDGDQRPDQHAQQAAPGRAFAGGHLVALVDPQLAAEEKRLAVRRFLFGATPATLRTELPGQSEPIVRQEDLLCLELFLDKDEIKRIKRLPDWFSAKVQELEEVTHANQS